MIFPERALPIGDDPVPENSLVVGEVYFKVHFADEDCICPTVLPLVLSEGVQLDVSKTYWYFRMKAF